MKQPIMTFGVLVSMIFTLIAGGCKDSSTDPPKENEPVWKEVVQFRGADIRYMAQHNGTLYASTYRYNETTWTTINVLLKTNNGIQWDTLQRFERTIGPIAFHGDTLTILEDGRTWKFHPSFGWIMFWKHLMTANLSKDMIWLNDRLFVFDNIYKMVYSKDTSYEIRGIPNAPIISRFVKSVSGNTELGITRPYYVYGDRVCVFNGTTFEDIMNGISVNENKLPNYPSLIIHDGELYAGFNTPSRIKKWALNNWINVSDTIPNTKYSTMFSPPLSNRPTSITFCKNKMFVGTEWSGVIEKTDSGWINVTSGLPLAFPDYPQYLLYHAVVQLHSFNNRLYAGFGEPWFAPVVGARGMYTYVPQ